MLKQIIPFRKQLLAKLCFSGLENVKHKSGILTELTSERYRKYIKYRNPEIHIRRMYKKQLCICYTALSGEFLCHVAIVQNSTVVEMHFVLPQKAMD